MNIDNTNTSAFKTPSPLSPSSAVKETNSPVTVADAYLHSSDGSSSPFSFKQVSTDTITKGILKKPRPDSASEKVPTDTPSRSLTFAENSIANDGEEKPTKMAPIKVVDTTNQTGRSRRSSSNPPAYIPTSTLDTSKQPGSSPRSKSAPQAYVPAEPTSPIDAHIDKAFTDAGNFIAGGLKKIASAAATAGTAAVEFIKKPEDFFIPDLSNQAPAQKKSTQPSTVVKESNSK